MTPHERAERVLLDWESGKNELESIIASAIEAHTADLRALLAQQAQRADEAERGRVAEAKRGDEVLTEFVAEKARADEAENSRKVGLKRIEFEMAAKDRYKAQRDAALAQITRYNEMAGRDADELARLRASEARLREALKPFAEMHTKGEVEFAGRVVGPNALRALYRWLMDIEHVHTGNGIVNASAIWDMAENARLALATPPDEWLEKVKREAKAEALEAHAKERERVIDRWPEDENFLEGVEKEMEACVRTARRRAAELRQGGK
jgi:hypothetical protein